MPQVYTKEDLMALGVYELRSLAREIGVKAPTMLTKEEIANAIILVMRGLAKPERTAFGRPVKSGKIVEALNSLKNIQSPEEKFETPKSVLTNFCSTFSNDMIIPTFAEVLFTGYVKLMQENTAIVMAKGYCTEDFVYNVIITKDIFSKYSLRDGDLVECYAASIGEGRPKVVTKINSINGLYVGDVFTMREEFAKLQNFYPTKKLVLSKSYEECTNFKIHDKLMPIGFGSRTYISTPNVGKRIALTCSYAGAISLNNRADCLLIAMGESPEDIQEIKGTLTEVDVITDNISSENTLELIETKINHALRMVELGFEQVLIISDICKFKNFLKDALKLYMISPEEAESIVGKKLLNLMNLAKFSGENGSLTIIALGEEKLIDYQNEKCLATINAYIKHNNTYMLNTLCSIDLVNSYINRKDKMFNNNEFIKVEKFLTDLTEKTFAERFKQFIK